MAIASLAEFYGGFAVGTLMAGVMVCRTYGGFYAGFLRALFILVLCCFFGVCVWVFAAPLPTQPSCESQAHADAPD